MSGPSAIWAATYPPADKDRVMFERAADYRQRAASILRHAHAPSEAKIVTLYTQVFPALLFPAVRARWPLLWYQQLEARITSLIRVLSNTMRTAPSAIFYLPTDMGGAGLRSFVDDVMLQK